MTTTTATHGPLALDARDFRIDRRFFARVARVARPYLTRSGAWRTWLLVGALIGFCVFSLSVAAKLSYLMAEQTNAIVARDQEAYWHLFALLVAISLIGGGPFGSGPNNRGFVALATDYLCMRVQLHWRQWMTAWLVQHYLGRRNYYEIAQDGSIDNPDQRIQGEVESVCRLVFSLPLMLLTSLMQLSLQGWILRGIAPQLFYFVIAFAVASTATTLLLMRRSIRLSYEKTVAEADLRYSILHVRDSAETIALYRGEAAEAGSIGQRLSHTVRVGLANFNWEVVQQSVANLQGMVWMAVPPLILAPMYFSLQIEYGTIAQATLAAGSLLTSLTSVTTFLEALGKEAPHVVRLAQIVEKHDGLAKEGASGSSAAGHIALHAGVGVALERVCLQTPGGEQSLVHELSLRIEAGRHLMIAGQTGVGKSSLLRAMAGLWTRGSGDITMPAPEAMLFLPQRPYMMLADLRAQMLYPATDTTLSDDELQAILARVSLPQLAAQHGGLRAIKDWGRVLSLGEQQRIAFARVLIAQPRYVFLDEATSAVDMSTEELLYGLLRQSGATFVSIGHRPSLMTHHIEALRLLKGGLWEVVPATQAMPREEATVPVAPGASPVDAPSHLDAGNDIAALRAA